MRVTSDNMSSVHFTDGADVSPLVRFRIFPRHGSSLQRFHGVSLLGSESRISQLFCGKFHYKTVGFIEPSERDKKRIR